MKKFVGARTASKMPEIGISESCLRKMIKAGEVPGFYSGNRYLINVELFIAVLDKKSMAAAV